MPVPRNFSTTDIIKKAKSLRIWCFSFPTFSAPPFSAVAFLVFRFLSKSSPKSMFCNRISSSRGKFCSKIHPWPCVRLFVCITVPECKVNSCVTDEHPLVLRLPCIHLQLISAVVTQSDQGSVRTIKHCLSKFWICLWSKMFHHLATSQTIADQTILASVRQNMLSNFLKNIAQQILLLNLCLLTLPNVQALFDKWISFVFQTMFDRLTRSQCIERFWMPLNDIGGHIFYSNCVFAVYLDERFFLFTAPVSAKLLRESGGLQALRSGLGMKSFLGTFFIILLTLKYSFFFAKSLEQKYWLVCDSKSFAVTWTACVIRLLHTLCSIKEFTLILQKFCIQRHELLSNDPYAIMGTVYFLLITI